MDFLKRTSTYIKDPANANFVYTSIALVVTGIFAIAIFYFASQTTEEADKDLSSNEEQRVLSEIVRNNPKSIFGDSQLAEHDEESSDQVVGHNSTVIKDTNTGKKIVLDNSMPANNSPVPTAKVGANGKYQPLTQADLITPDLSKYNYRETTTTTIHGPGFEKCEIAFPGGCGGSYLSVHYKPSSGEEMVTVDYEYFDRNHSYYKTEISVDNEPARLDLSLYGDDINSSYQSAYGSVYTKAISDPYPWYSNAYRLNEDSVDSYANSYPSSYADSYTVAEEKINDIFGNNSIIRGPFEVDGSQYYEVTYTYTVECEDKSRDLISVYRIDAESYTVTLRTEYIDSISNENLRYTQTVVSERKQVTMDEVLDTFDPKNIQGTAKTIDYTNFQYDPSKRTEQVVSYLTENNIPVVLFSINDDLNYLWSAQMPSYLRNQDTYLLRDYYSQASIGTKMYDQVTENFNNSNLVSFSSTSNVLGQYQVTLYDLEYRSKEDIAPNPSQGYEYRFTTVDDRNVNYSKNNGGLLTVDALKVKNFRLSSAPSSYPLSYLTSYGVTYPTSYSDLGYTNLQTNYTTYFFETDSYSVMVGIPVDMDKLKDTIIFYDVNQQGIPELISTAYK